MRSMNRYYHDQFLLDVRILFIFNTVFIFLSLNNKNALYLIPLISLFGSVLLSFHAYFLIFSRHYSEFIEKKLIPVTDPKTIADGLLTSLSEKTFNIIVKGAEKIITVSEDEIISSMKLIWERMKIICEPSCAVPLAAILKTKKVFKNKNVGIILTGGNVDLKNLPF